MTGVSVSVFVRVQARTHSAGISGFVLGLQRFFLLLSVWVFPTVKPLGSAQSAVNPGVSVRTGATMTAAWSPTSWLSYLFTGCQTKQKTSHMRSGSGVHMLLSLYLNLGARKSGVNMFLTEWLKLDIFFLQWVVAKESICIFVSSMFKNKIKIMNCTELTRNLSLLFQDKKP